MLQTPYPAFVPLAFDNSRNKGTVNVQMCSNESLTRCRCSERFLASFVGYDILCVAVVRCSSWIVDYPGPTYRTNNSSAIIS